MSALASVATSVAWSGIQAAVTYGIEHNWSTHDIAVAAQEAFDDSLNSILNSSGETADDHLSSISDHAAALLDAQRNLVSDLDIPPVTLPDHIWDARDSWHSAEGQASPLVIDLSSGHTGVELTAFNTATTTSFFDIEGTGFAQQTAWVAGDTGLLCRDMNGNGKIDSVSELFGSTSVDGFSLLATLDTNDDHRIDQNDSSWSTLQVWTDTNGDAITQDGELHTLSDLSIKSIDLAGVTASTDLIEGNTISHISTVTFDNSSTATIADAWFTHDAMNSYYNGDYTLDVDTLFLPTLRGFGTLPDLAIAMSLDSDLKNLVSDFASNFSLASLADPSTLDADVKAILYEWAGVAGMNPSDRANGSAVTVDARDLTFLERLFGEAYDQHGNPYPLHFAGEIMENTWQTVMGDFKAHLLVQLGADALFDAPVAYNPYTGVIDGTLHLSQTAISDLALNDAPGTDATAQAFWVGIADFIDHSEGIGNLNNDELTWLGDAVQATTSVTWSDIVDQYNHASTGLSFVGTSGDDSYTGGNGDDVFYGFDGNDTLHGGAGADHIIGGLGDDAIYGDAGNDLIEDDTGDNTLNGGDGNDRIYGGTGDDVIAGGGGGNFLYGAAGNDTYVFGGGDEVITDGSGTDQIVMPSGITMGDLTFTRGSTENSTMYFDDLLITVADGGGTIQITDHFTTYGYTVETLVFADSSTLDLTTLTGYSTVLTSGNDYYSPGINIAQTVHGLNGSDVITTGNGNDTLDGGVGNDILNGQGGDDTYIASPGFDTINDISGTDTIQLPDGIAAGDLHFLRHSGTPNDLEITVDGLGQIVVANQFYSSDYAVDQVRFSDNSTLALTTRIIETVGTSGNDYLTDITAGASSTNIMDGREGDDAYSGSVGYNDTFFFSPGSDTIDDAGGTDTLAFHAGINFEDLSFAPTSPYESLTITQAGTGDNITIHQQFDTYYYADYHVENLLMDDGFHLNLDDWSNWQSVSGTYSAWNGGETDIGSSGADTITGGTDDDALVGMGGNDVLHGGDGADQLRGGDGADTLYGDAGNDWLWGGNGADTLSGGNGNDVLAGGDGADAITGGTGADTFVFDHATAFNASDTIADFSTTDGDKLDIHDLLTGYDPLTSAILDFVRVTASGSDAVVSVDADGPSGGAANFVQIAMLTGQSALAGTEADLLANGHLLAHAA